MTASPLIRNIEKSDTTYFDYYRQLVFFISQINRFCVTKSGSAIIMKSFIFLFFSLAISIHSFGQFTFKDDNTDMRIQGGVMEEIDKKFNLQKDNEFEFRLFILPNRSDNQEGLYIFIISFNSGLWKSRLFKNAWSTEQSQEIPLKSDGLDNLWKELDKNNVINIPLAQTLVDKSGKIVIDQLERGDSSILYSFELLTKDAYRSYAYKCPLKFSKKYDYISTFKSVSNIVQLILLFCKIEKMSC